MMIGAISYLSASGIFLVLLLVLLARRAGGSFRGWLALASAVSAIWAAGAAYQQAFDAPLIIPLFLELLRDLAWLTFLMYALNLKAQNKDAISIGFTIIRHGIYVFTGVMALLILYLHSELFPLKGSGLSFIAGLDFQLAGHLLVAVIGLVLLEQLLRNTPHDPLRAVKYLCFGVGGIFTYDFYLYSDALLFQRINPALWEARGFVNAIIVPVIGVAVARSHQWSLRVSISRRIIFHSSALFGSGIYLLAMGVGGYYVRDYGGTWGTVAQTIFLFGAGLVLLILLFSVPLRARLRVSINKHFFHYKYDYREEWLRFIRTLSASNEDTSLPERAIRAIAQMMDSPGGLLWMRTEHGHFEPAARWNMDVPPLAKEPADSSLIRFLEIQKWVINLDEYQRDPGMYRSLGDLDIPRWLTVIPNSWLISPLILHDHLLGFVVLARSPALYGDFNWEDCDLLKTTGTEAASHLAQHAASQALVEARQFEAINRLSTYIVHDLKNLITQLSLVVSNAAKHRNNPLFMENAISTVDNSVAKMNRLLKHFRDGVQDDHKQVDLAKLLEEAVHDAQAAKPAPCFECHARDVAVAADRDRLASVVGHVIRNAQDATPEEGRVVVALHKINGRAVVEVRDTGCGMDESFIKARLFHPFQTTKGESGMGIGVYEAREFVRALGGEIHVESKLGAGTVFRIHLPYVILEKPLLYKQGLR